MKFIKAYTESKWLDQPVLLCIPLWVWANSVDPDQTQQNAVSDQGLHCLPLIQQVSRHINGL